MPTIDENRNNWNRAAAWQSDGHEWSASWGSTQSLWYGTTLPRIAPFLPTGHLLEIACGHGRMTELVLQHCERYTGVDVAPNCVEICTERFEDRPNTTFFVNDGRSLTGVDDASIDFAFSWDSLVHADRTAIEGYVADLARVLRPGACAFLHHSNFAALLDKGVANEHWRDETTSAEVLREICGRHAALECTSQEIVQWGARDPIDCFSVLRRLRPGENAREPVIREHPDMGLEIEHFRLIDSLYRAPHRPN